MKTLHQSAAVLALAGLPTLACAQAWVTFGASGGGTAFTNPVATQGSLHVGNAFVEADFFGSASLSSGILRAQVSATPAIVFTASPVASSETQIHDLIKIVGPGTAPVPLHLQMDVDALITVDPTLGPGALASLFLGASMTAGNAVSSTMEILRVKTTDDFGAVNQDDIQCIGQPCDLNQPLTLAGVVDGQIALDLMLSPGFYYEFLARLQGSTYTTPGVFGEVDASHTARLSYTLPPGYTLASQSGVFLSAVPEPQAWALWAAGLLAVAALRTRALQGDGHA